MKQHYNYLLILKPFFKQFKLKKALENFKSPLFSQSHENQLFLLIKAEISPKKIFFEFINTELETFYHS